MVKSAKKLKKHKDKDDSQSEKEIEESEEFMLKAQERTRRGAGDAKTNVEMMILARGTKLSTPLPEIIENELMSQRSTKIIVPWREFDLIMSELNGLKIANNMAVYDPCRPEFDVLTVGRTGEDTPVASDDDEAASDDEDDKIQNSDDDDDDNDEYKEDMKKKKKGKKKKKIKVIKKKINNDGTSDIEATTGDEADDEEDEDEKEEHTGHDISEIKNEQSGKKLENEKENDQENKQQQQPPTSTPTTTATLEEEDIVSRVLSKKEKRALKMREKTILKAQAAARRAKKKDDARKRMDVRKQYLDDEQRIRDAVEGDVQNAVPDYEEGGRGHLVLYIESSQTFVLSDKVEMSLIMMLKEGRESGSYRCGPSNSVSTQATDANLTMSDKKKNVYKVSKAHMMCKGVNYLRNTPVLHRMWRRFVRLHLEPQLNVKSKNTESNLIQRADELYRDWYREQVVAAKEEEEELLIDARALSSSDDSEDERDKKNKKKSSSNKNRPTSSEKKKRNDKKKK